MADKKEQTERMAKCVAAAFVEYLNRLRAFKDFVGLPPKDDMASVCMCMSDKHGRFCRQVKHALRGDPKEDWPIGAIEALQGYFNNADLAIEYFDLEDELEDAIVNELMSASRQWGRKEKK